MNVTIEMLTFAVKTYPDASPAALEAAGKVHGLPDQSDYDVYCDALTTAVETFAPRITVEGMLGTDKEVTKKQFTTIWMQHIKELRGLSPSLSDKRLTAMCKEVMNAATAEFNRIYDQQQATKAAADKAAADAAIADKAAAAAKKAANKKAA